MKTSLFGLKFTNIFHWRPGKLAIDTLVISGGMGMRTLLQAGVFLIVARVLSVDGYGAYAAVLAIAGAIGNFSGLGTQSLIVRDISRKSMPFSVVWYRTLTAIAITSPILFIVYLFLSLAILPADVCFLVVALIGIAELVFIPLNIAGISAYQGHEYLGRASRLILTPLVPRISGALLLLFIAPFLSAETRLFVWGLFYAVAAAVAAVYSWWLVRKELGLVKKASWFIILSGLREGLPFALGGAALKLYADIDKAMLARLANLEAAGAYSAGYQLASIASMPIIALLTSTLPRFFRAGESNLQAVFSYGYRILPIPLAYAIISGVVLYLVADYLPYFFGESFAVAIPVLQWLAWLPLLSLPRLFTQNLLIGNNRQHAVILILIVGSVLNISLNLHSIPLYGWRGAVFATYIAEISMAVVMLAFAWIVHRNPV